MQAIIDCLTYEHHHGLLAAAALVCVLGSSLTAQIARRLISADGARKRFQTFLAALIGGATVWSTHFFARLAVNPGYPHGYEPAKTGLSLLVAVVGLFLSKTFLGGLRRPYAYGVGGLMFGATVSAMHYIGMLAFEVPGIIRWNAEGVVLSIALGGLLGAAAYHRLLIPITRYCWLGGALLMVLSICSMHFSAMMAFEVELSPLVPIPQELMPDTVLSFTILSVTTVIFFVGYIGLNIETHLERETQQKMDEQAKRDALTGLPNRLQLSRRIDAETDLLAHYRTRRTAILSINLTRFKEINDLYGYTTGDAILVETGRRLQTVTDPGFFIARTSSWEFVALKTGFRRVEEIKALAERLNALISEPITVGSHAHKLQSVIGIATSLDEGRDPDDLLQKAALAMARANAQSGCSANFYNAEMDQQARARLQLVDDLRRATDGGEFHLAYQIQNDVMTGAARGFEVLLRWKHPIRGNVPPSEFIPLAEDSGLICDIGLWVLRTACLDAASWRTPYTIAINVAPQQFAQPSFLEHVSDILIESRLPPERLELEVTESSIIDDEAHTLEVMHKIKEMGIGIAMDDFGTGYSSLSTLRTFPFDKIKVDRSFVQGVHKDPQRAAILRSTLLLGAAFDIPVLAEGVECETELAFLRTERCQYVQGFLFGKPMGRSEIEPLVNRPAPSLAS